MKLAAAAVIAALSVGCAYTATRVEPDSPADDSKRRRNALIASAPQLAAGVGMLALAAHRIDNPPEGEDMLPGYLILFGASALISGTGDLTLGGLDFVAGDSLQLDGSSAMFVNAEHFGMNNSIGAFHWPARTIRVRYALGIELAADFDGPEAMEPADGWTGIAPLVSADWAPGGAKGKGYSIAALTAFASTRAIAGRDDGARLGWRTGAGGCVGWSDLMTTCITLGASQIAGQSAGFEGALTYEFHTF
jgi:hypothetical protein